MFIKNVTDLGAPKPIGIGTFVIMPGEEIEVPDEVAYVDEIDRTGRKTGKKVLLPAIVLLKGLRQVTYEEKQIKRESKKAEKVEEPVKEPVEETKTEEAAAVVEEKPKRGRKKAE